MSQVVPIVKSNRSKFSITVTNEEIDFDQLSERKLSEEVSPVSLSASYKPFSEAVDPRKERIKMTPSEISKCIKKTWDAGEIEGRKKRLNKSEIIPSHVSDKLARDKLRKKKNSCTASCVVM